MNKKQRIEDSIAQIFQENGMSYKQRMDFCKALTKKFAIDWLDVLCSDWFAPLLLQYLTLKDITKLDMAMCNRSRRPHLLEVLEKHSSFALSKCRVDCYKETSL